MNFFEMKVKEVFYFQNGSMIFSGKFISNLPSFPFEANVFLNEKILGKVILTNIPIMSGKNVKRDINCVESSNQVDLKTVLWEKDIVFLRSLN